MAYSPNGYPANDVNLTSSRLVPGTTRKIRVRNGPAGDLLLWVASQFDKLVEDIEQGILDDWGYAERPIRGSTTLSNHASGTAIDLNATSHPLSTEPTANFTASEIATIRQIVARTEGCVRWGGDYTGRKDGMHFEIDRNEARCAAVLAKLTASTEEDMTPDQSRKLDALHEQFTGSRITDQYPGWNRVTPKTIGKATLVDFVRQAYEDLQALKAGQAGLVAAVAALSNDSDLDKDAVEAIIRDAVKQNLRITGTVDIGAVDGA